MLKCNECGNEITYHERVLALRSIKCKKCGVRYNIEIKNIPLFLAVIASAFFIHDYLMGVLDENLGWISFIVILGTVVILMPFNQRLEKKKS